MSTEMYSERKRLTYHIYCIKKFRIFTVQLVLVIVSWKMLGEFPVSTPLLEHRRKKSYYYCNNG